jgi:hypothetical protein
VKRNNSQVMFTSRIKLCSLFFGLNQTQYQQIDIRGIAMRLLCPSPLAEFLKEHKSFSVSGHPSQGEGGDFVLEAKNRRSKMWMPPDKPTETRWLRFATLTVLRRWVTGQKSNKISTRLVTLYKYICQHNTVHQQSRCKGQK